MASPVNDDYTRASSGAIAGGRSLFPAWRQSLAVNQWVELVGSSMAANPPTVQPTGFGTGGTSPPSILETWSGLAIDARDGTLWSLASGGHNDYYGNQVMRLRLALDAPIFEEVCPSDATFDFTIPSDSAYYSNGHPASCHTYWTQFVVTQRNRAMRVGCGSVANSGNPKPNVDGFDVTRTGFAWDPPGTYPSIPSGTGGTFNTDTPMCMNPATGDVFALLANNGVRKWVQATNTWAQINVGFPPISPSHFPCAYDTTRDRIFAFGGTTIHHTFDPVTGKYTSQTMDFGTVTAFNTNTPSAGMIYEPVLDAYLVRCGPAGGNVYRIDAETFAVTDMPTTGGSGIPQTAVISGSPHNVYGKWLYAPSLGGCAYIARYSANCWFIRTH